MTFQKEKNKIHSRNLRSFSSGGKMNKIKLHSTPPSCGEYGKSGQGGTCRLIAHHLDVLGGGGGPSAEQGLGGARGQVALRGHQGILRHLSPKQSFHTAN